MENETIMVLLGFIATLIGIMTPIIKLNSSITKLNMVLLGFIATLIGIMTPIIKLNSSITKLNTTIDTLDKNMAKNQNDIKEHEEKLNDHETRITVLEKR